LGTKWREAPVIGPALVEMATGKNDLRQSLWLDNITRGLLMSGTLRRYINEFSVTGLTTPNPTIFDKAIKDACFYDDAWHDCEAPG
jgi:hypothetical protein